MRVDHKELDCKDDLKLRKFDVPKVKLSLLVWNKKNVQSIPVYFNHGLRGSKLI